MTYPTIVIPKGKKILEVLQELDGGEAKTKDIWFFMHIDVVLELATQVDEVVFHDKFTSTYSLIDKRSCKDVVSITLCNTSSMESFPAEWSTITKISCSEDAPFHIAFKTPTLDPKETIFLKLEK